MRSQDFPPLPFVIRRNRWLLLLSIIVMLVVATVIVHRLFIDTSNPVDPLGQIAGFVFLTVCIIGVPPLAFAGMFGSAEFVFSEAGIAQLSPFRPGAAPIVIRWEEIGGVSTAVGGFVSRLQVHRKDGPIVMTTIPLMLGVRSSRMRAMILHYRRLLAGIPADWTSPAAVEERKRHNIWIFVVIAVLLGLLFFVRNSGERTQGAARTLYPSNFYSSK